MLFLWKLIRVLARYGKWKAKNNPNRVFLTKKEILSLRICLEVVGEQHGEMAGRAREMLGSCERMLNGKYGRNEERDDINIPASAATSSSSSSSSFSSIMDCHDNTDGNNGNSSKSDSSENPHLSLCEPCSVCDTPIPFTLPSTQQHGRTAVRPLRSAQCAGCGALSD